MPSTAVTPPGYTFVRSVVWMTSAAPGVSPLLLTTSSHDSAAVLSGRRSIAIRFAHERASRRHGDADVLRHRGIDRTPEAARRRLAGRAQAAARLAARGGGGRRRGGGGLPGRRHVRRLPVGAVGRRSGD